MSGFLPSGWKLAPLEEFATLQRGHDLTKSQFRPGPVPVAGSNGVIGYHDTAITAAPGITVGRSGSVGKVTMYREDFWPHNTSLYVRDFHGNDPIFAGYLLKSLDLARFKTGASVPTLDRNSFKSLPVIVPPLREQQTIAHTLSTVERAIKTQDRIIQTTTELKQALMQKLFSEGLRGEPQKETEIGLVPESWGVVKIKNHCIDSAFGPRFGSDLYAEDGNILTLRTTDMEDDGRINYNTAPLACIEHTKFRNHYLQVGDVIVSRSGTCGIASVFEGYSLPVLPGAFLIRLRMEETVQPMYLRHYINSPVGRPYVLQLAQGAIQKNISGTRLGELLFPLPTRAEQEEISSAVRSVDQSLVLHRHKLRAKRDLFSTLIHELMTAKSHVNLHTINGYNR